MERLTPQEEIVMLHIWELKECAIKDVVDKMEEPKFSYTIVASTFANLEKKKYITMRKFGNMKVFRPTITEAAYKAHFLTGELKSNFDDPYKELATFLTKEDKITQEELTEIIQLIEKNRKK